MCKKNRIKANGWPVVALLMVVLTATPGIAAEPPTGEQQKERTSVTLGFSDHTDEMADAGLTGFRAVVAPPEATGTVLFTLDGKDLGPPVPVEGGIADSEPVVLSLGRGHSVEAEYSGDARFESSRDEMENVRTIGDNQRDPNPMPGFEPSALFIGLIVLLALALLIAVGSVFRRRRAARI